MTGQRDAKGAEEESNGQSLAEQTVAPQPILQLHPSMPHYAQMHFAQNHALQEELREFWDASLKDVEGAGADPAEFKNQQLPLARIKKIMKSDEDVRMISAEAPVLFAKACEFFILEMTKRAWNVAQEQHRRTLQRSDIAVAIARTHIWDFLLDTVPLQEAIDATAAENRDDEGAQQAAAAATGTTAAPPVTSAGPSLPSSVPSGAASMPPGMNMFAPQFLPPMGPYNPMMPQGLPYPPPGMFPSLQQYQSGMPQQLGQDPTSNASTGGRTDNS